MKRSCARCGIEFECDTTRNQCPGCRQLILPRYDPSRLFGQPLSHREKQIVALIVKAEANKIIAWKLHLTEGTIKDYVHHIFLKVGVTNRTALAMWAYKESLAHPA